MKGRAPPLVSCVVPVFDGERYLAEALESILAQTHRPLEVVVVDDGSTDGTRAVVEGYRDRVRYLWQENRGPAAARNRGIEACRGEFVAFLDADDLWHREKLERQLARFEARPELEVCVCHARNFWVEELAREREEFREHRRGQAVPAYATGSLLARRSLFERVGLFDAGLQHADDTEWFLRPTEGGLAIELLPDVLLLRRMHPESRSRTLSSDSIQEYLHMVKASLDRRRQARPGRFPAAAPPDGCRDPAGEAGP